MKSFGPDHEPYQDYLGDHGYDNREKSMHPILYAFGPAFRRNLLAEPFRNVDIYSLMSYVLRLNPRATNGSLDRVKHILVDFPQRTPLDYLGKYTRKLFLFTTLLFSSHWC